MQTNHDLMSIEFDSPEEVRELLEEMAAAIDGSQPGKKLSLFITLLDQLAEG